MHWQRKSSTRPVNEPKQSVACRETGHGLFMDCRQAKGAKRRRVFAVVFNPLSPLPRKLPGLRAACEEEKDDDDDSPAPAYRSLIQGTLFPCPRGFR
jgi:hypothetical protein